MQETIDDGASPAIPIVAIGASAGGLDAIRQLFADMPTDTGMAFVVIQHLDAKHPSILTSVLAADVRMPVVEVSGGMRAEANRVHVIPPGSDLGIARGLLTLRPREQTGKLFLPIDTFFRSLAADQATRAMGVVLSGTGSDGTEGLRAIEAAGGITFAQDPDSAVFRGMPESAIAASVVSFRLPPTAIAHELVRLSHHAYLSASSPADALATDRAAEEAGLAQVLAAVLEHAQLDFTGYTRPTLLRRIARRMALRPSSDLQAYARALDGDPVEARAMAQDILVHATSFFRDPAVFEALEQQVLPSILDSKGEEGSVRVWVAGCATGEETYSMAMCLLDFMGRVGSTLPIKIFGSDLSAQAIDTARAGTYAESAMEGVSPDRLARFFDRVDGRYRIAKRVRELCVFVRHDLTRDPPFAKLDLITCRNVLIYFGTDLQRRVVPLLHHCLNKPGYLLLGTSEAVVGFGDIFTPVDKEHRIFAPVGESPRIAYPLALTPETESRHSALRVLPRHQAARAAQRQADHIMMARYAPPGVVVNERLEVVQFRGRTGDYLEAPPGQPQSNILKMARGGLVRHLREALDIARTQSVPVRREGVPITEDSQVHVINLEVIPLATSADGGDRLYLVLFETASLDAHGPSPASVDAGGAVALVAGDVVVDASREVVRLKAELAATMNYLQSVAGEHKDTTEELAAANDEMATANEELQSTNEELESAKEELHSTNEELTTLNDELRYRNQQLDVVASDLVNVLESVQIPVIMLDRALRIRRFTPAAREIANLIAGDLGRSIEDVRMWLRDEELGDRIRQVIATETSREWEVQALTGRWFSMHIRPYRTTDGSLDGATLSFLDVDVLKHAVRSAEHARDYAQGIVETVPLSLAALDVDLNVVSANPTFYRSFHTTAADTERTSIFELLSGAWDVPALRRAIDDSLASHLPFRDLELQCALPARGLRDLMVAGSPLVGPNAEVMLLLAMEDITERRVLEASARQVREELEKANDAKDLFLATLSHELRTPLSTIVISAQILQLAKSEDPRIRRSADAIQRAVGQQVSLIDDLLDISRIAAGKLVVEMELLDLSTVVEVATEGARSAAEAKGIALTVFCAVASVVRGDRARLRQVVANLLHNAVKFTPPGGRIEVRLSVDGAQARLAVTDNGAGIAAEVMPRLFERFVQAESAMTRAHGGMGLGLAIVHHLVEVHGGQVRAESAGPGKGATFTVTLPLVQDEPSRGRSDAETPGRGIVGVRVLLIEDDADTREACSTALHAMGVEVWAEPSAAAGLAALMAFQPQVILCDVAMPGEDGYSFIRKLRERDTAHGGGIPAAALTALAGEDDRRRALAAGFQMHLAKPVDALRLARAVEALRVMPVVHRG